MPKLLRFLKVICTSLPMPLVNVIQSVSEPLKSYTSDYCATLHPPFHCNLSCTIILSWHVFTAPWCFSYAHICLAVLKIYVMSCVVWDKVTFALLRCTYTYFGAYCVASCTFSAKRFLCGFVSSAVFSRQVLAHVKSNLICSLEKFETFTSLFASGAIWR